jgi:hypothetical protein
MTAAVRRVALIALAGAALALGTAVPAVGHTRSYFSSLSLAFHRSSAGDTFDGRVGAPKAVCKRGRKVVVHKIQPGSDTRIGADVTGSGGKWVVDPPGKSVAPGRYYATMRSKVLRKTAAHDHSCAPVTTLPLTIGR